MGATPPVKIYFKKFSFEVDGNFKTDKLIFERRRRNSRYQTFRILSKTLKAGF